MLLKKNQLKNTDKMYQMPKWTCKACLALSKLFYSNHSVNVMTYSCNYMLYLVWVLGLDVLLHFLFLNSFVSSWAKGAFYQTVPFKPARDKLYKGDLLKMPNKLCIRYCNNNIVLLT